MFEFQSHAKRCGSSKDAPIQAKNFCEYEDKDHHHEHFGFSHVGADTLHKLC